MSVTALAKSSLSGSATTRPGRVSCFLFLFLMALLSGPQRPTGLEENAAVLADRYRQEGLAFLEQGKTKEALARFRSAVELNPADAVSRDCIGGILAGEGPTPGAMGEFQRAIEIDPDYYPAQHHLALSYDGTGRTAEAIEEYQQALRRKPDFEEARYALSAACWKLGDVDGAISLLQEIVAANPQSKHARYNLGVELWQRYRKPGKLPEKTDLDADRNTLPGARPRRGPAAGRRRSPAGGRYGQGAAGNP
jgi:tetratricopeptide (TPR) repeat protein